LKTPLTSLKGYIQLSAMIAEQVKFKPIVAALEKADLQVNRMNEMIKSFLDVSRLESGGFRLIVQHFELGQLVAEIVHDMVLMTPDHPISIEGADRVTVDADREKIGAVISNFLTNAIKYSPPGTPITVNVKKSVSGIVASVQDQGIGISREHTDKIFERFYRVNNSKSETIAGFGIGLYYCQQIIKLHHGTIRVESEPRQGSTFSFSLPVATTESVNN
jgi:two-component system sensor histidine kinase VicK